MSISISDPKPNKGSNKKAARKKGYQDWRQSFAGNHEPKYWEIEWKECHFDPAKIKGDESYRNQAALKIVTRIGSEQEFYKLLS